MVVLGAVLWGLSRCRREDSGESTCPGEFHLTGAEGISVHGATAATWQISELQHPAKRAGGWGWKGGCLVGKVGPLPVPRQLWPLLIYCRFLIYVIGPQEILSTAMSSTGPGRSHTGLGPGLRRRMQAVNREPRLYIPPPSPNLLHASNFRSPNPAPGPGLATPSRSTVRLLQVVGSRERPPAERNPRSQRGIGDP